MYTHSYPYTCTYASEQLYVHIHIHIHVPMHRNNIPWRQHYRKTQMHTRFSFTPPPPPSHCTLPLGCVYGRIHTIHQHIGLFCDAPDSCSKRRHTCQKRRQTCEKRGDCATRDVTWPHKDDAISTKKSVRLKKKGPIKLAMCATHCNAPSHTAAHCNTLQRNATHWQFRKIWNHCIVSPRYSPQKALHWCRKKSNISRKSPHFRKKDTQIFMYFPVDPHT